MICFSLICSQDHSFDSWFANSQNFEALQKAGHLSCPACGDSIIRKALMAPAIAASARTTEADVPANLPPNAAAHTAAQLPPSAASAPLSAQQSDTQRALAQMRAHIEANSEYVGLNFAAEARAMHDGVSPARAIYGEAKPDEARALLQDGIPVAPLPFFPRAKLN